MNNHPSKYIFSIACYAIGILLGLALAIIAAWSDVESSFYGFDRRASSPLGGLSCPILMTRNETQIISLTVSNTTDNSLSPSVRTEASTPMLPISTLESVDLLPGQSKTMNWTVGPENIDLGNFIFFKALVYAAYPIEDRETTCGIFVINTPGSGNAILILSTLLSLIGIGVGLKSLGRYSVPGGRLVLAMRPMSFLAGVTIVAMIVSFLGWWLQGIVVLVVALLTLVVTLDYLLIKVR